MVTPGSNHRDYDGDNEVSDVKYGDDTIDQLLASSSDASAAPPASQGYEDLRVDVSVATPIPPTEEEVLSLEVLQARVAAFSASDLSSSVPNLESSFDWMTDSDRSWVDDSASTHYSPTSDALMELDDMAVDDDMTIDLVSSVEESPAPSSASSLRPPPPLMPLPCATSSPVLLPSPVPAFLPPSPALSTTSSVLMSGSFVIPGITPLNLPSDSEDCE